MNIQTRRSHSNGVMAPRGGATLREILNAEATPAVESAPLARGASHSTFGEDVFGGESLAF